MVSRFAYYNGGTRDLPNYNGSKRVHRARGMSLIPLSQDKVPQLYDNRDLLVREQWVKIMKLRIVREKLEECYHSQSVNHMQNCRELVERYLKDLPGARIAGRPPFLK
ncbi:hypothetical protein H4R18_000500 [Coemansia javaensis]|uniref:Uncharacterized protein n=1 Tax=Coemansia javaensis TaxID=2761396 RepID=A0A9W8HJP5_9FUNG|nr:hypothetical protein H4R18_000500 [Coemansia javaensis]